jgi:3'-5' exoribonuclease
MMEAGIALCSVYTSADKDLVVAGILFHDYGKIFEIKPSGSYTGIYTPDALLGHIYMGAAKVQEFYLEGRLTEDEYLQLAHIVLSHHGKTEWGSPVTPRTAEARIVHAIDSLDADFYKIENAVMTTPEGELCATASRDGAYYHPHPLSGKKGG